MTSLAHLPDRAVLRLGGADRVEFLNGLVSNQVARATPGTAVWAGLLTAQGRYITDFFIFADDDGALLLDMPQAAIAAVAQKFRRMRLRAAVTVDDVSETYGVYAAWDGAPPPVPVTAPDPRLAGAGFRCLSPVALPTRATTDDYKNFRLQLGLPDGPPDLEPEKTLLLEAGFDELGGVDFTKGCYMGQELTARTKYRGLIKRRLIPVALSEPAAALTPVTADGVEVGSLRSTAGRLGLANLRLDALGKPLLAGTARLTPRRLDWMRLDWMRLPDAADERAI
jgi:folate-binding protein YgfZ